MTTPTRQLPADFVFLRDMYQDSYFPRPLVDRLRDKLRELVGFLESGPHTTEQVQAELDRITCAINDMQSDFEEADSEIETVARDSIGTTVEEILGFFSVDIEIEEAIRERDW